MNQKSHFCPRNKGLIKIFVVFGTRPEAIKMAPVVNSLEHNKDFQVKTVNTGQHREMLEQVLTIFKIKPDYDLNIMFSGQNLTDVTCRILQGLEPILYDEMPDLLLVQGDTATTFASALAAFYHNIRVGHVEAGLRTGDKKQPFPEELNRLLTGRIADIHFAPTVSARDNLLRENIPEESIFVTGNTVIDALQYSLNIISKNNTFKNNRSNPQHRLILVTVHHRESWGTPLNNIIKALKRIIHNNHKVILLIPVHLNPIVRTVFYRELGTEPHVQLVEPLDYFEMVKTMKQADIIITDSGGIQEEAPALGKPVLALQEKSERMEAVNAGAVRLVGTDPKKIVKTVNILLNQPLEYQKMSRVVNPYGDGTATERIIAAIRYKFGMTEEKPIEFIP